VGFVWTAFFGALGGVRVNEHSSQFHRVALVMAWAIGGLLLFMLVVFAFHYWMAPRRQRDEARDQLRKAEQRLTAQMTGQQQHVNAITQRQRVGAVRGALNMLKTTLEDLREVVEEGLREQDYWKGSNLLLGLTGGSNAKVDQSIAQQQGLGELFSEASRVYRLARHLHTDLAERNRVGPENRPAFPTADLQRLLDAIGKTEALLPDAFEKVEAELAMP
jgi:hypothetical protein